MQSVNTSDKQYIPTRRSTKTKCKQIIELTKQFENNLEIIKKAKIQQFKYKKQKRQKNKAVVPKADQAKILKLFKYSSWNSYVEWIDEKLQQSGQVVKEQEDYPQNNQQEEQQMSSDNSSQNSQQQKGKNRFQKKKYSQEIIDFELTEQQQSSSKIQSKDSSQQSQQSTQVLNRIFKQHPQQRNPKEQEQLQLLALQNGRLRRENIILKNKLVELRVSLKEN